MEHWLRVASHGLVVIPGDHQHRDRPTPPTERREDEVELPRREHRARVPEVAKKDDARGAPAGGVGVGGGLDLAEELEAHGQRLLAHVEVGEDHPLRGQCGRRIVGNDVQRRRRRERRGGGRARVEATEWSAPRRHARTGNQRRTRRRHTKQHDGERRVQPTIPQSPTMKIARFWWEATWCTTPRIKSRFCCSTSQH